MQNIKELYNNEIEFELSEKMITLLKNITYDELSGFDGCLAGKIIKYNGYGIFEEILACHGELRDYILDIDWEFTDNRDHPIDIVYCNFDLEFTLDFIDKYYNSNYDLLFTDEYADIPSIIHHILLDTERIHEFEKMMKLRCKTTNGYFDWEYFRALQSD